MPAIGAMRDRYTFQRMGAPVGDADQGAFEDVLTAWAATTILKGGEGVQAARLQGSQPVIITIRAFSGTRQITNAWRAVDARDPSRIFDVQGAEPTADRAFIDVLAVRRVGQNG